MRRFEAEGFRHSHIIFVHIAAEISRVVGIDGGLQAQFQHFLQGMLAHVLDHAQLQIA